MNSRTQIRHDKAKANDRLGSHDLSRSAPASAEIFKSAQDMPDLEGNENIRNYVEWLGLNTERGMVVLSSLHHYYYDAEEMKSTRTVVNMKELNQIRDINSFLKSLSLILPPGCNLVGCFTDNKKLSGFSLRKRDVRKPAVKPDYEEHGISSGIPFLNTIFSILDARTNNYMSASHVARLLRKNGFNLTDMTELDGLTCFSAKCLPSKP